MRQQSVHPEDDLFFRDTEAQRYMKPGEVRRLMSEADKAVLWAVEGPQRSRGKRRLTIRGIEKKTGLSAVAVTLATYRLMGLGLLAEKEPPKNWKMPKRTEKAGSNPRKQNAEPEGLKLLAGRKARQAR